MSRGNVFHHLCPCPMGRRGSEKNQHQSGFRGGDRGPQECWAQVRRKDRTIPGSERAFQES